MGVGFRTERHLTSVRLTFTGSCCMALLWGPIVWSYCVGELEGSCGSYHVSCVAPNLDQLIN